MAGEVADFYSESREVLKMRVKLFTNKVEFCVMGHSRSGTGYMSALFGCLGYQVGHEHVQKDGISSWLWAINSPIVPFGPPRANTGINHLFHVVRDPWNVVSSLVTSDRMNQRVIDFMSQYIYIDKTADKSAQAAYMIIGWNRLIQAQTPELAFPVERAADVLPNWLTKHGYKIPQRYKLPPSNYNTDPKSYELEMELMTGWPKGLLRAFRDHYQKYGYPVPQLLSKLTE
jgi:hypothetical protein